MAHVAVYKSRAAEYLDDFYSGDERPITEAYEEALALLAQYENDRLSAVTAVLNDPEREVARLDPDDGNPDDFEAFWLSDDSAHGDKQVDRVLRHGYREAIEIARGYPEPVPIETFWITGASDEFELHICAGKRRVTVFMFVPQRRRYGSTRSEASTWVVRVGGLRDDESITIDERTPQIVKVRVSGRDDGTTA
jgi:hypothetical protein